MTSVEGDKKEQGLGTAEPARVIIDMAHAMRVSQTFSEINWTHSELGQAGEILQAGRSLFEQWRGLCRGGSITARIGGEMLELRDLLRGMVMSEDELNLGINSFKIGDRETVRVFSNGFVAVTGETREGVRYGYVAQAAEIEAIAEKYNPTLAAASSVQTSYTTSVG